MGNKTFVGGWHVWSHKELTRDAAIVAAPLPPRVVIPLAQHAGIVCRPLVKAGDTVLTGQKIGDAEGLITAPVHASISGKVTVVGDALHPVLGSAPAVTIESDGADRQDPAITPAGDPRGLSRNELVSRIRAAGIVGLGGAAFPTHVKLSPQKPVDVLIINGVECEPYLTCDYRLLVERPDEILDGIGLLQRAVGVEKVYIGIEDDKPLAIRTFQKRVSALKLPFSVVPVEVKYPQGAEKQLIKALVDREVPPGKLPFDVGVVVSNAGTALAAAEAVFQGKPLYERTVTVTGTTVREPKNIRVRLGTSFAELIAWCGGTTAPAGKIVMGGPMMGLAQFSDAVPVVKGTSGILVLSTAELVLPPEQPCIRCARCVDACPMQLLPYAMSLCAQMKQAERARVYNPSDCIECGVCTYVCPSKRRILEHIRLLKVGAK
ncbi:MAG: electron transport complex subunit RsxC [Candidatus Omnitrophica bacterium]|nr:electron transport complex subunit RsxC [Candidatus Omnitrophota bacterium]